MTSVSSFTKGNKFRNITKNNRSQNSNTNASAILLKRRTFLLSYKKSKAVKLSWKKTG